MPSFQLSALPAEAFAHLTELGEDDLARLGVRRVRADSPVGYPCRVSLVDAEVGEELFLLSYTHHAVESPYRASGPIFVRVQAQKRILAPGELPPCVRSRAISARAYDDQHLLVAAELCDGELATEVLERLFARHEVRYVQLHNARAGCFSCEARRVAAS